MLQLYCEYERSTIIILSLNNLANPSTNVPSVVATKCDILDNLLQTTSIASFLATNSNLVIKSTIKCVYGFSRTFFSFPISASILFFIYHNSSHVFPHLLSLPATSNFLLPALLSFTFLHILLLVYHDITGLFLISMFLFVVHLFKYSLIPSSSYCSSFLQRILVLFEVTSKV